MAVRLGPAVSAGTVHPAGAGPAGLPHRSAHDVETAADPTPGRFRLVDILSFIYFGVNTALLAHPNRPDNWPGLLGFHLIFLLGVPLAVRFSGRNRLLAFFRDWYPLAGIAFAYTELRYLNRILTDRFFDAWVIRWEDLLFRHQLAVTLRQWLPWKPLGEVLHLGYFSYYLTLPALFVPLWLSRKYGEFRTSVTVVMGVYYFCYLWYVFFPVTGPYWQFPKPDPNLEGWFFPQLTNRIVAGGSSHGSAFPSSHIAASVTILGLAARFMKPSFRLLVVPVTLLCVGTVYGGFHYGVDALGGLAVAFLAVWLGPGLVARFDRRGAWPRPGEAHPGDRG